MRKLKLVADERIVTIVDRRKMSKINSIVDWKYRPVITSVIDFVETIRR
jgi:hypothetical protein